MSRIFRFLVFIGLVIVTSLGGPKVAAANPGISSISYGRFAGWPLQKVNCERDTLFYEGDLTKRIGLDYIERDGKDVHGVPWRVYFGWTSDSVTPEAFPKTTGDGHRAPNMSVETTEASWIHKRFTVTRDFSGESYVDTVRVTSATLGTWISSDLNRFYLDYAAAAPTPLSMTRFTQYAAFDSTGTIGAHPIPASGTRIPITPQVGSDKNWILFWGNHNDGQGPIIPLMVSFSAGCDSIAFTAYYSRANERFIEFQFDGNQGGSVNRVALSFPFGLYAFSYPLIAETIFGDGSSLPSACTQAHQLACSPPRVLTEDYVDDGTTVTITNTVTSREKLDPATPSQFRYVPLPPLVTYAASRSANLATVPAGLQGFARTKYGTLKFLDGTDQVSYSIASAPPHDIHFVPNDRLGRTIDQDMADRMINTWIDGSRRTRDDFFSQMNNRGAQAALMLATPETQRRYRDRVNDIVEDMFDPNLVPASGLCSNLGGMKPFTVDEPAETLEFTNLVWRGTASGNGEYPYDLDASAGTALEFLYEYLLWDSDRAHTFIANHFGGNGDYSNTIYGLYRSLEIFQDWSYMSASHDLWGGTGGIMDMFAAEYAAYHSFAEIADDLGYTEEANRARYLQAKAQIPFMMRWVMKDSYLLDYYKFLPSSYGTAVLSGFGEDEPSGPLGPTTVFTQEDWADWTISGERLHLLGEDVYQDLLEPNLPGNYSSFVSLQVGTPLTYGAKGAPRAGFPEAKVWAALKNGDFGVGSGRDRQSALDLIDAVTRPLDGEATDVLLNVKPIYRSWKPEGGTWYGWDNSVFSTTESDTLGWFGQAPEPSPVYAGILESFASPVFVGGWTGMNITGFSYDEQLHQLTVNVAPTSASGTVYVSSLDGLGVQNRWNVLPVTCTPGTNVIDLPTVGGSLSSALISSPGEPGVLCTENFENMGGGRSNIEKGWTGDHVSVRADPLDSSNRGLFMKSESGKQSYALTYEPSDSTDVMVKLSFRYRVPTDNTTLRYGISVRGDNHCFQAGTVQGTQNNCPENGSSVAGSDFVNSYPVLGSGNYISQEPGVVDDWTYFECRGPVPDVGGSRVTLLRLQATLDADAGGATREAWIDDVQVARGASVGYSSVYEPTQGQVFQRDDDIPFAWYPDARVEGIVDQLHPQTASPGSLTLSFWWVTPTDSAEITIYHIPGYADGASLRAGRNIWQPVVNPPKPGDLTEDGAMRLKAVYTDHNGSTHAEYSPEFVVLSAPPSFETRAVGGGTGSYSLDDLVAKDVYSTITADYNDDDKDDLIVSIVGTDEEVLVYENVTLPGSNWATFQRVSSPFAAGSAPSNARGMSFHDFDADGVANLFVGIPGTTAQMLEYTGSSPIFAEMSGLFPSGVTQNVWAGDFGNVGAGTEASGLYLARAGATDTITPAAFDNLGVPDVLLRWNKKSSQFEDITATALGATIATTATPTIAVAWKDVNGDRLQDLYVAYFGNYNASSALGWSPLFIQQADSTFVDAATASTREMLDPADTQFSGQPDGSGSTPEIPQIATVSGIHWVDIDNQYGPDLLVTREHDQTAGQEWNALLILNNGGGEFAYRYSAGIEGLNPSETVAIGDLDGNHLTDFVVIPTSASGNPDLDIYMGYPSSSAIGQFYANLGPSTGIPALDAKTAAIAEFNPSSSGDGMEDLFVGQTTSAQSDSGLVYMNRCTSPSGQGTFQVVLSDSSSGNPANGRDAVVQTTVVANGTSLSQSRAVGGSSGRGSQSNFSPIFAKGDDGTATVTVTWPDGYVQNQSVSAGTSVVAFVDDHYPTVIDSTVTYTRYLGPSSDDWEFTWETELSSSRHEVIIWDGANSPPPCRVTEEPDPEPEHLGEYRTVLDSSRSDVDFTSVLLTGGTGVGHYRQTFIWHSVSCKKNCEYSYQIRSHSGDRISYSGVKTFDLQSCGQVH